MSLTNHFLRVCRSRALFLPSATRTTTTRGMAILSSPPTVIIQRGTSACCLPRTTTPTPTPILQAASNRSMSSSSFSPVQWWQERQQNKEAEKYKERVLTMAQKEDWTLNDMKSELDEVVSSWTSKVPGLNNNKETKIAKKMHQVLTGLVNIVGPDATMDRLDTMTRTEKLKAAAAAQTSVQEINMLVNQFSTTSLMHKVLRARKVAGKALPETPEATQAVVQTEGRNFLSAQQKQKMIKHSERSMKKSMRRR